MIYSDLVWHRRQWDQLQTAVRAGRLAHAHLFHGPAGSGKEGHALELGALLNCRSPRDGTACGLCDSCLKMATLQHPDLHIVVPLPRRNPLDKHDPPLKALRPADVQNLQAQLQAKGSDPYHKVALEGAHSILINSIRELRRTAALKPAEGGWRVILIFDAEKLAQPTPAAANALLKLLEEPPPQTVFILVTDRPNLLPPTIHSRCLRLHFPALPHAGAKAYIISRYNLDPTDADVLIHTCGGNLHLARQVLASGERGSLGGAADDLLEALLQVKPRHWERLVNDLAQLWRRQPAELHYRLQMLQLWFRDLLVLSQTGSGEKLIFGHRREQLQRHLDTFPRALWGVAALAVESGQSLLERQVNPALLLTNLILDIRQAMKGREAPRVGSLAAPAGPA